MSVTQPVPPGAAVVVFAAASGATAATAVTDSQGNAYTPKGSATTSQYLQAFTTTAAAGLNPAAGDAWTVTFGAANTQVKTFLEVAMPGASAVDVHVAAGGTSAAHRPAGRPRCWDPRRRLR